MTGSNPMLPLLLSALAVICHAEVLPMAASSLASVHAQLQAYVNARQVQAPSTAICDICLFKSWIRRSSSDKYAVFPVADLPMALRSFPGQVQEKVQSLVDKKSSEFESFSIDIESTLTVRKSFIGLVRRMNDLVEVAILGVDIEAQAIPACYPVPKRIVNCSPHDIRKCVYCTGPRDYDAKEISDMKTTLQSEAFKMFKQLADRNDGFK